MGARFGKGGGWREMASKRTVVRGVRAEQSFWERCDKVAREKGITRNALILKIINTYLKKEEK